MIALVRAVFALNARHGHSTELLYTATEQVPTSGRGDVLRYFWRALPGWVNHGEWRGMAIPHWPLPLWATYALPAALARSLIRASAIHAVVSGSNHCGLPAALLRRRYVAWTATLYRDELEGRAAAGDEWARRMIAGRAGRWMDREEGFIFRRAALILALSSHTADRIRHRYPEAADRVRLVPYPVDTDECAPDLDSQRERVGPPFILLAARIRDPRKNVNLLIRTFARVRAARPDLSLVVAGDDPFPQTRALAGELGLSDAVEFRGLVPRAELIRLYHSAELFALPSLQEGLGISAMEALACGLPVVSTRCGGPEGFVSDGHTGKLVENGNAGALAEAILELLADPARLEAMRSHCVEYVRAHFARSLIESQLLDAFHTVYPEHFN
ncbi:MAG: glycosyltransferase family 4 protein [Chloroflexi bacterium]|nr:glycosyltransferase family 4 protein [Chloroflexota bacterium]